MAKQKKAIKIGLIILSIFLVIGVFFTPKTTRAAIIVSKPQPQTPTDSTPQTPAYIGAGAIYTPARKDFLAIRWDAFNEFATNTDGNDLSMKLATGFTMGNGYMKYRPFHSYYVNRVYRNVTVTNRQTGASIQEARFYDINFRGNHAATMQAEINYAADSGINGWAFGYYSGTTGNAAARHLFKAAQNKRGLKACYILNKNFDPQSQAEFLSDFSKDWYYKLDGKPVVIVDEAETQSVQLFIKGLKQARAIYTVMNLPYGASQTSKHPLINSQGFDAVTWYQEIGNQTYQSLISAEFQKINDLLSWGIDVIPCFTVACAIQAYNTVSPYHPIDAGNTAIHQLPVGNELADHLTAFINTCNSHARIRSMNSYSWNEHLEGLQCLCPAKDANDQIDRSTLDIVSPILNNRI